MIVPLDKFPFSRRHRGGKIINIEGGTIDNRPYADIGQQAVGGAVKTSVYLFKKVEIVKDYLAVAVCIFP